MHSYNFLNILKDSGYTLILLVYMYNIFKSAILCCLCFLLLSGLIIFDKKTSVASNFPKKQVFGRTFQFPVLQLERELEGVITSADTKVQMFD